MSKKLITLSVCLIATTLAFGQTTSQPILKDSVQKRTDNTISLEEVIVTANKLEQKQSSTGKVVTVINAATLQANAGRTIAQILNEQAGLYLPGSLSNAGTVPSIYMRGASSGRTLILIDGMPVGDPSMISNEFDLNLVPLYLIERIEILKGAQSTLYGSDAIGGVINIITKNKSIPNFSGDFSTGSYGTRKINLQHSNTIGKLNYAVGFGNEAATGFSSATDITGKNNFDKDGYKNNNWFANINYAINQNWNAKVSTHQTSYNADIDYGAFKDDKDEKFNNTTKMTGLVLKYKKEKSIFQFQYQLSTQDRQYKNDSLDRKYTIFEDNQYIGKSHFADAFYSTPLSKNIQWILGGDFRYGSFHQTYVSLSKYGPYNDNFKDTFQYQTALYSSLLINDASNKWLLELGGRLNKHSRYGANQTFTISPSYKLNRQVRLMASASTGYKAPSLYQLSNNDALKPEQSFNTEIGIEYNNNTVFARGVYYNRTIDNGIDYNYIDYNFFNYIRQKVNGTELEFNWKANEKNNISLNYTLMNGQETNQNRVTTTDTITYKYLLKRPKNTAGIQWSFQPSPKLNVSIAARYISKRYDVGGYATEDVILKSYTLLNAHIQYSIHKHFIVYADGQNLGNTVFNEINGYNAMGRMLMIGLRIK
ncbi:MAG: TonB-dependent receptor [Sediminibacterium sp.]|jgi:vitamin B12 transporter|nr:MAG: TonB-dependent receptor [Sediminibacterium sp.]